MGISQTSNNRDVWFEVVFVQGSLLISDCINTVTQPVEVRDGSPDGLLGGIAPKAEERYLGTVLKEL